MRKLLTAVALAASLGTAQAALLTFDDVPGGSVQDSFGTMPNYMGFNFSCTGGSLDCGVFVPAELHWVDAIPFGGSAVSGDFALTNSSGGDAVIRAADGSAFNFDGLWARAWTGGDRAVSILGFNGGTQVWSVAGSLIDGDAYVNFGGMSGAVDELRLQFGEFFLVDDLALSAATGGPTVPEPASFLLTGLGLAALGVARRSTRKTRA